MEGHSLAIDRLLIREIRQLDEYDLRRLLILVKGILVARGEAEAEVDLPSGMGKVSYRSESVRCGKAGCTKCPHGPYWYAYWREDGVVRSRYIGKNLLQAKGHKGTV